MVERRLGRGLDFFLSDAGPTTSEDAVTQVPVTALSPSQFQPRQEFPAEELEELSLSIRASGILQPILVRRKGLDRYEIIAGERRWRAAQLAGLDRIPALVRDVGDEMVAVFGVVENLQRMDLNPIEKAHAFQRIQELTKGKQEDVARQVGLDRSTVANFVRLLDLAPDVQAHVSRGTLSMGHARALLGIPDPDEQRSIADAAIRRRLSVRQVEELVRSLSQPASEKPGPASDRGRPVWVNEIEETLAEALHTPVKVRYGASRSRITIECAGRDQFERVYELLKSLGPADEV